MGTRSVGFTTKLMAFFIAIGLLPMAILGFLTYKKIDKATITGTQARLITVRKLKKAQLEAYLNRFVTDVKALALAPHVRQLFQKMVAYELASSVDASGTLDIESPAYSALWRRYGQILQKTKAIKKYHDLYLINADSGFILYSLSRKSDLGQNLKTGQLKDSGLGRLWAKIVSTRLPAVEDFSFYMPSAAGAAAFVGAPIISSKNKLEAVLAMEVPISRINAILKERGGQGRTGKTYLVGRDYRMRSDLQHAPKSTVLSKEVRTDAVEQAFQGNTGCGLMADYRGKDVWSCYTKLDISGLSWALLSEMDKEDAMAPVQDILNGLLLLFGLFSAAILAAALVLTRRVSLPIRKLAQATEELTRGKLDINLDVRSNDELGRLSNSFNKMAADFRSVVNQAKDIAAGDYSAKIEPRSEEDQLGEALSRMTTNLRDFAREKEIESWLKTGQAELSDKMQGRQDFTVLAREIITYLARYLGVHIGLFYLTDENLVSRRVAGYALPRDEALPLQFRSGEGLVGQAALEMKTININDVPEGSVKIGSGLLNASPYSILVMPVLRAGKVKGVLELGSFKAFTCTQVSFVELVTESIAIAIDTAQSRFKLQELLEETQSQAEELETQQEELRQANEELQERGEALERERGAVEKKNEELESARQMIELKASDLETASKYKSEFMANMSHELRTPLNSLLILSKLMMDNKYGNLTEKQVEFCQTINSSGAELLELINDILDLSKVEAGKIELTLEDVELKKFMADLELKFRPVAETRNLDFVLEFDPALPVSLHTDGQRLGQILKNLLSNAFKFTEKGRVTLSFGLPSRKLAALKMGLGESGNCLAFEVSDTGIGVPENKQKSIFEAFQQADGTTVRKYGGTGLGLSISRELTRLLQGSLHLESELGKGSRFTVLLPMTFSAPEARGSVKDVDPPVPAQHPRQSPGSEEAAQPPRRSPSSEGAAQQPPSLVESTAPVLKPPPKKLDIESIPDDRRDIEPGDKSLLLIEDEPKFAQILVDLARESGFKVLVAAEGETGLHLADYYKPSAILLDLGLPGMDGMTVLTRLKENLQTRHIPVHIISGHDKRRDALRMGAVGFLRKPINLDQLDHAFSRIEGLITRPVRRLLLVEDDQVTRFNLSELLGDDELKITAVSTGQKALDILKTNQFDCMVLDLGLPDMDGLEMLTKLRMSEEHHHIPVIIFTGKDLSSEDRMALDRYAERVIIKDVKSAERLIDETTLFLHRVEKDLPENKRQMIELLHNKESIFQDKLVLIVDDDMRNIFALTSVLEEKGIKTVMAADGRESLKVLDENPGIHLVLMDIMMPVMDGYEAMRKIRDQERFKRLPVIALTAKAMKGDRAKCVEAGASDYLAKPVDTNKLLSMLRVWLYQ